MKKILILIIGLGVLFYSCKNIDKQERKIQAIAHNACNMLDNGRIQVFYKWSYGQRGHADIWSNLSNKDSNYTCLYFKDKDTVKLTILRLNNFKNDFPFDILIDTSKYRLSKLFLVNEKYFQISVTDNYDGKNLILGNNIPIDNVFKYKNPFKFFKSMNDLKDSLGIVGTFYRPDIGNFVQFYITYEYLLTYLPDSLYIDSSCKQYWEQDFAKGKTIKKNWNLRKLAK